MGQQPRLLEHLEVKRKLRLGQAQVGDQITDAALSAGQGLDHLQAQRISEGLEQGAGLVGVEG